MLLTAGKVACAHSSHPEFWLEIIENIRGICISENNHSPFSVTGGQVYDQRFRAFTDSQVFSKFFARYPSIGNHLEFLLKTCLDPDATDLSRQASLSEVVSFLKNLDGIFQQFINDNRDLSASKPIRFEMFVVGVDASIMEWDLTLSRFNMSDYVLAVDNSQLVKFYEDVYCTSLKPLCTFFFKNQQSHNWHSILDSQTKTGIMYCWEIVSRILGVTKNPTPITNLCKGDTFSIAVVQVPLCLRTAVTTEQLNSGLRFGINPDVLPRPIHRPHLRYFARSNPHAAENMVSQLRTTVRIPHKYHDAETQIVNLLKYYSNVCNAQDPYTEMMEFASTQTNPTPLIESDGILLPGAGVFVDIDMAVLSKISQEDKHELLEQIHVIIYNLHRTDFVSTIVKYSKRQCKLHHVVPLIASEIPQCFHQYQDLDDFHKTYLICEENRVIAGSTNSRGIVDSPSKFLSSVFESQRTRSPKMPFCQ